MRSRDRWKITFEVLLASLLFCGLEVHGLNLVFESIDLVDVGEVLLFHLLHLLVELLASVSKLSHSFKLLVSY